MSEQREENPEDFSCISWRRICLLPPVPAMTLIQLLRGAGRWITLLQFFVFVFFRERMWALDCWLCVFIAPAFFLCWNIIYLINIFEVFIPKNRVIWSEAQIKSWSVTEDKSYFPCPVNALLAPVVFPSSCPELRNVAGLASVLGAVPATPAVLTKQRAVPCRALELG